MDRLTVPSVPRRDEGNDVNLPIKPIVHGRPKASHTRFKTGVVSVTSSELPCAKSDNGGAVLALRALILASAVIEVGHDAPVLKDTRKNSFLAIGCTVCASKAVLSEVEIFLRRKFSGVQLIKCT
ncbi:hypothetical protein EVAR_13474_1 [Eumeta japonica]|uniref:Uncharacterized protein n=1 Tax=Eumeta variegata TaxID=151549 RepID=A0A4C1UY15_EUMVA|nr:hypothetical protein EVAR_13474_1 [Eumeta japonica]